MQFKQEKSCMQFTETSQVNPRVRINFQNFDLEDVPRSG